MAIGTCACERMHSAQLQPKSTWININITLTVISIKHNFIPYLLHSTTDKKGQGHKGTIGKMLRVVSWQIFENEFVKKGNTREKQKENLCDIWRN